MGMLRTKQILDFVNDVQSAMSAINATQNDAIALNTAKTSDINHNVTTDLSYTAAPAEGTVVSSDGTDAVLPLADATNAGLLSPAEKVAIANSATDAELSDAVKVELDRALLAEKGIQDQIDGLDETYATDAELSDAIAQEVIDRNTAIKTTDDRVTVLLGGSTAALDTFGEIKGFIEGLSDADVTIIAAVSANSLKETNVDTNLSYVAAPAKGTVESSDGTDAVLPLADATNAGLLSPAEKKEIADNTIKVGISVEQAEKLERIEANATADQTDAEIRAAVEAASDSNVFTDADHTKLNEIEANADVTDSVNVEAAGALMDTEVTNLEQVKAFSSADYATAAQGILADAAATEADLTLAEARILALEADIEGFSFDSAEVLGSNVVAGGFQSKTATFQVAANDELDVFVNGLQVHRAAWASEELKAAAEGWVSEDGINFTVQNLGYDLDTSDHIIISGKIV
ncbi:hypothetical protein N9P49_00790 [bacterium]|nr:hypothetical protein [bacterium]